MDEKLLEIRAYDGEGYMPLIDYGEWRVAVLRFIDELLPDRLDDMQRHEETDEVFVLLEGKCILFLGKGNETVEEIYAQDMEPLKLYNVKRGVWHNHTLTEDATVLIVENLNTVVENSPHVPITKAQTAQIVALTRELWGDA